LRKRIIATCLALSGFCFAQKVEFIRTVPIHYKGSLKKDLGNMIIGKIQENEVRPFALCKIAGGRIAITDSLTATLHITDMEGRIIKSVAAAGKTRLQAPVGLCTDEKGNIFVSDNARKGVLKFDKNGKFLQVLIHAPESRITGIAYYQERFFCVDTQNHRIMIFAADGHPLLTFGKRGNGEGEFNYPTHIAVDEGYVYVTDAMNFRVQIFEKNGKFLKTFGTAGTGGGNFSKPKGIAVDRNKRIYVADAMFDNVQIFSFDGTFLYYFGNPGSAAGDFWMPAGLLIDESEQIWVADTYNKRIQIFKLSEDGQQ
jgi:DNA-binding beta-propeller fold protein YncE